MVLSIYYVLLSCQIVYSISIVEIHYQNLIISVICEQEYLWAGGRQSTDIDIYTI